MNTYLSSYQIGNCSDKLQSLFDKNKKVGLICNAINFLKDEKLEQQKRDIEIQNLKSIGLHPIEIDLREYFDRPAQLREKLSQCGGVWVRGGNTFVLAYAYHKSGFDKIIRQELVQKMNFVYAGYSAGCCVLQKNLKGIDFVDNPNLVKDAYGIDSEIAWEGVGILDYVFVPHFESDHVESEAAEREVGYYKKNNIEYKTLRDGEALVNGVVCG